LLSRYACLLIAMNAESTKREVGFAMTYFAVQTRRQELSDERRQLDEQKRLEVRLRIIQHNKVLAGVAKRAGVKTYAFFQDAGYRGMYGMGLSRVKQYKGIEENEDLLDRVGRLELSANDFRITLAEYRLKQEGTLGEQVACQVHATAGEHVREAIMRDHGQTPEDLPTEPSIKRLVEREKRRIAAKAVAH
jgi:DNA-damage-inducible protein D